MTFSVHHVDGSMSRPDSSLAFETLLDDLARADDEHPDVGVTHESGWGLSVFKSGTVVWEDVEAGGQAGHLNAVPREQILMLMRLVATGDLKQVHRLSWLPGYP